MKSKKGKLLVLMGIQWSFFILFFVSILFQFLNGFSFNISMFCLLMLVCCYKAYQIKFDYYARTSLEDLNAKIHDMGRNERRKYFLKKGIIEKKKTKSFNAPIRFK